MTAVGTSVNSSTTATLSLSVSSAARIFAYYRVVADAASCTWNLSTAVKWSGGVTAYLGVNEATPLDSAVATAEATGPATWIFKTVKGSGAWRTALKPGG